jgi:predicted small lipoprotein YifL
LNLRSLDFMRSVRATVGLILVLCLAALLPACGKKGPLYLPDDATQKVAPAPESH